jgi:uncharacterized protein (TIGR01732 family)
MWAWDYSLYVNQEKRFILFSISLGFVNVHGAFSFLKHILNVFRIMEVEIMSSCGSFGNSFALIIVLFILLIIIGATCFGKGFGGDC